MSTAPRRDIIVIAASAGGVEALRLVLAALPADLPAAVLIVLHVPATGGSSLPHILDRAGALPVSAATDGAVLSPGHAYVAPPDRHLLVDGDMVRLSREPAVNGHRPAADQLFLSAARTCGHKTIAVVLSGTLDDGALGCAMVERSGGLVVVQDPDDCVYDGMPKAALAATQHAHRLPLRLIGAFLDRQSRVPIEAFPQVEDVPVVLPTEDFWPDGEAGLSCPDCGGPLLYQDQADRYSCRVGHDWSAETLLEGQSAALMRALAAGAQRLAERVRLARALAAADPATAHSYTAMAAQAREALHAIRQLLTHLDADTGRHPR